MDPGIRNRALQHLVLPILKMSIEYHPFQFGVRGRGVHAAVERVADAIADGYTRMIEIDIRNFFESFDGEWLKKRFLLPEEVAQRILSCEYLNLISSGQSAHVGSDDLANSADDAWASFASLDEWAIARRGIPQGSVTSSVLAECVLAEVFTTLPAGDVVITNLGDNTLIQARDIDTAEATAKALVDLIEAHPAGQFRSSQKQRVGPWHVDFLGHRISWDLLEDDDVLFEPLPRNRAKFHRRLRRGLRRLKDPTLSTSRRKKLSRVLRQYVQSWCGAYKLWRKSPSVRLRYLNKIQQSSAD